MCCFCCRPQSTRHLTHLFTVRTIAINSIENVESKCACTLVTGTHKCFNIFTPTSHYVGTLPPKYTLYSLVLEEVHPKRSRLTLLIFVTAHSHLVNLCILTCWINLLFTNILYSHHCCRLKVTRDLHTCWYDLFSLLP